MFKTITYYSGYNSTRKVHMAYCHIITGLVASLGIGTTVGNIMILFESFDKLSYRQISLAGTGRGGLDLSVEDKMTESSTARGGVIFQQR